MCVCVYYLKFLNAQKYSMKMLIKTGFIYKHSLYIAVSFMSCTQLLSPQYACIYTALSLLKLRTVMKNIKLFYIYIYIYIYYQSKVFGHPQKFLFLILKVLFFMKQVKHHNVFIHYSKYKSSLVTFTLVLQGIFWKIDCSQETTVEEAKQCQKALVGHGAERLDNRAVE